MNLKGKEEILKKRLPVIENFFNIKINNQVYAILEKTFSLLEQNKMFLLMQSENKEEHHFLCKVQTDDKYVHEQSGVRYDDKNKLFIIASLPKNNVVKITLNPLGHFQSIEKNEQIYYTITESEDSIKLKKFEKKDILFLENDIISVFNKAMKKNISLNDLSKSKDDTAVDIEIPPERIPTVVNRIIRDTKKSREVKALYNYICQICEYTFELPNGKNYAEAHHIKPLGGIHNGLDVKSNIICVCPNCHAMLDFGSKRLDKSQINILDNHNISNAYINYHNDVIYNK